MGGKIVQGHEVSASQQLTCDVCIVGSGAGGSVLAAGLAAKGLDVVMLEAGGYHTKADFDLQEGRAYPMLYQDRGTRGTADQSISVLQGRSVGGSTTVNWTTCFRTPDRILQHWAKAHGVEGVTTATMAPHFAAVEKRLNITKWPLANINANNRKLYEGAKKLGWEAENTSRNVKGCANSGYCGVGCPVDGKQAMAITYIADAIKSGMRLYSDCQVTKLARTGQQISEVQAEVLDRATGRAKGPKLTVKAKVVVASGGAINTPALLLKSGLNGGGLVGKRTFIHPVVTLLAEYKDKINGFYGAPQSISSHQFAEAEAGKVGFFLETAPVQPMLMAQAAVAHGPQLMNTLANLPHIGAVLALAIDGLLPDEQGGTVTLRSDGRMKFDYAFTPQVIDALRQAHLAIAKMHLAAGALRVTSLHTDPLRIQDESGLKALAARPYGPLKHPIFTAHQMGGCPMGGDPKRSVVDSQHRFRGVDNLFVVDGSVLPTSLGVNPSQTIYGLAHRAREFVAAAVSS
ncbi:MAG: GMC family oxidoreductase [Myxococcales bacterium]|nr:GMC family oxidoreductase [Myxococcales bacterium]